MLDKVDVDCFHCGLPVPGGTELSLDIFARPRPMCCAGCLAVAQTIVENGLGDFYRFRTETANRASEIVPHFLRDLRIYDNSDIQRQFVSGTGDVREATLILEGINCPACVWVNERALASLDGVLEVSVNYASRRAHVRWDERRIHLSDLLHTVHRIGYVARPFDPHKHSAILAEERRTLLRRLGVAGVFGMQVMMLSVALYSDHWSAAELRYQQFFHWVCLLLTVPVVGYSARTFFESAWRDLGNRVVGMDVPVSLAIALAFAGSAWTTATDATVGTVYYDSVVMFVFFLLTGRYLELVARKKAVEATENLTTITPAVATRLVAGNTHDDQTWLEERVPMTQVAVGDRLLVRAGDHVPADGVIVSGCSSLDESLLTGESTPCVRASGANVIGGSINVESPLQIEVTHIGPDAFLSRILRTLDRAQSGKPAIETLSDHVARWFVTGVLIIAAVIAVSLFVTDNARWFETTLAVLVVACPCALSLATPAAITAATGALMRQGILVTRGNALEILARSTHVIFDKTGTLTHGALKLADTLCFSDPDRLECLRIATALEAGSEHPLAKAFARSLTITPAETVMAKDIQNIPGQGIVGRVNGTRYVIGTAALVERETGQRLTAHRDLYARGHTVILLADDYRLIAAFLLADTLRESAKSMIAELQAMGKNISLMTGDHRRIGEEVGQKLGITRIIAELKPDEKLMHLKALQREGAVTAMVGDGLNDVLVLAGADVSIAFASGADLARANADLVLINERCDTLLSAFAIARKTLRIIRQNIRWAIAYNVLALPAAIMGYVAPWLAAIGMSLSSLVVVGNALRAR